MAFDFSKLNFFNKLDARGRVVVLFGAVVVIILVLYFTARFLWGGGQATGTSRVGGVPAGVQYTPYGEVSPEYAKALQQANIQAAQQARMTGTSAIATITKIAGPQQAPTAGG